jgi:post-GPI attachment to proteins factor 3
MLFLRLASIIQAKFRLTIAMSLEIFDFAPFWRVIDAHSLWHAATAGIISFNAALVLVYWDFLLVDSVFEVRRIKGKGRPTNF